MARNLIQWTMKDLKEVIEGKVNNKFDCIIFIEGNRGLGKSTLAYKILSQLNVSLPFNPRKDIVYSREDTLKALANKKGGCIFSDEMINVAYNRDFYNEEQKALLKYLNMFRDSCNVFIGCIPSFIELDKQIQRLCQIRISVVRRGVALIHTQKKSMFQSDCWDIKNNQKIESQWTNKGTNRPRYARLTTIKGILRFGDLQAKQRNLYETIKAKKRGEVAEKYKDKESEKKVTLAERVIEKLKNNELSRENFKLICEMAGIEEQKVRQQVNKLLKDKDEGVTWRDLMNKREKQEKGIKKDITELLSDADLDSPNPFESSEMQELFGNA